MGSRGCGRLVVRAQGEIRMWRAIQRLLKSSYVESSRACIKLESVGMDGEEGTTMRDVYTVKPAGIVNSLDVRDKDESQMMLWNHLSG